MNPPRKKPQPWPPQWARAVAWVIGLALGVWEAIGDSSAHLVVYGFSFALTGLPISRGLEAVADALLAWRKS